MTLVKIINESRADLISYSGRKVSEARRLYGKFVKKGVSVGKRPELVGGGLIRSLGGWVPAKTLRGAKDRIKGDERILGDGNFVQAVLKSCQQQLERRYHYQAKGYDFKEKRGQSLNSELRWHFIHYSSFDPIIVGISQPTASQSAKRGERIVKEKQLKVME